MNQAVGRKHSLRRGQEVFGVESWGISGCIYFCSRVPRTGITAQVELALSKPGKFGQV